MGDWWPLAVVLVVVALPIAVVTWQQRRAGIPLLSDGEGNMSGPALVLCSAVDVTGQPCALPQNHVGPHQLRCPDLDSFGQRCGLVAGHVGPHILPTAAMVTAMGPAPQTTPSDPKQWALVAAASGAIVAIGSLLPWATISAGIFSRSKMGTDGDGMFTLAGGILAALLAFGAYTGRPSLAGGATVVFGLITLLVISDGSGVAGVIGKLDADVQGSIGIGLWLTGAGAIVGAFASFHAGRSPRQSDAVAGRVGLGFQCARCGKLLGPTWKKCEHCKASFAEFPPIAMGRTV